MIINKLTLGNGKLPEVLTQLASPPKALFHRGAPLDELVARPRVAIVGSRMPTVYGKKITQLLASELARQGVVIISGLALGVDAIAHRAALEQGGLAIAVLPGPVDRIYPVSNYGLANRILEQGGALLSEYESYSDSPAFKSNFVARNRIVAGLSQVVLITEAAEKSGSLHTARFAIEAGIEVMAVPGNIDSQKSIGTNNLLKHGASPVTLAEDVIFALKLIPNGAHVPTARGRTANEQRVIDLLARGIYDGEGLLIQSQLSTSDFNQVLTMLELGGKIRALGANQWSLR